jgi:hypothetical protein
MKKIPFCAAFLLMSSLLAGLLLVGGCVQPTVIPPETAVHPTTPQENNPYFGTWQYFGVIGANRVAMQFMFLANGTGRFDLVAPDLDPPYSKSMAYSWESEGDQLWLGSSSEQQHMVIRYDSASNLLKVTADDKSGIFIGENFFPGPFYWEFTRVKDGE